MQNKPIYEIIEYLNTFIMRENIEVICWQIVPVSLEGLATYARYSCIIEARKLNHEKSV